MTFGLCNTPTTFQRLMEAVLGDLAFDVLLIYLNNIVIFSTDFESHCKKLDLVFSRTREHGLKLKPGKCFWLKTFLGHVISAAGIQVNKEKVKVLEDWPIPKNVTEIRQVVGFMGYYRRFVPNFTHLAKSLHQCFSNFFRPRTTSQNKTIGLLKQYITNYSLNNRQFYK